MTASSIETEFFENYAPDRDIPVRSYGVLMSVFLSIAGAFATWFRASGREMPARIDAGDLALLTVASHKASRMIAKDRVATPLRAPFTRYEGEGGPGEVSEQPRGGGLRRAVGELLVCPYCLGMWTSAAFVAGLLVAPRFTRAVAAVFTTFFGSEMLQIAYKKAEGTL
jgi:hypothetical protein